MSKPIQLIAGEPLHVLLWGLRDLTVGLDRHGGIRFDTSSGDEVGRAWSRAIERTGADLLRPRSTTPQQLRQCKAFRQLLGQIERRLRKELALLGAD